MKYFIWVPIFLGVIACKKEVLYKDGGVINNPIDTTTKPKEPTLKDTRWILTYMQKGFSIEKPNDTIDFKNDYTIAVNGFTDNNSVRYLLVKTTDIGSPYTLTLMNFTLFGGNGYWKGTVPNTFINDGIINLCDFTSSSSSITVRATFKRLN